jgi:hypothetical protein
MDNLAVQLDEIVDVKVSSVPTVKTVILKTKYIHRIPISIPNPVIKYVSSHKPSDFIIDLDDT